MHFEKCQYWLGYGEIETVPSVLHYAGAGCLITSSSFSKCQLHQHVVKEKFAMTVAQKYNYSLN